MLPFYPNEFDASTKGWPAATRGIYLLMLAAQWQQIVLPLDSKGICRVLGCSAKEFRPHADKLLSKFPQVPGGRQNYRLEQHRLASLAHKEKRSKAGAAGAAGRWQPDSDRISGRNGNRTADAMASDSRIHRSTSDKTPLPPATGGGPAVNGTGKRPRADRDQSLAAWRAICGLIDHVNDSALQATPLTWQHVIDHAGDRYASEAAEAVGFRAIADRDRFTTASIEQRFRLHYEREAKA